MKNKKTFFIILLVLVLLLVGAGFLYSRFSHNAAPGLPIQESGQQEEQNGQDEETSPALAPDFTVTDNDGNTVKLSDFRGKPVIVNFWASWCGPCRSEMPDFNDFYDEYGDRIHFLMVNATDGSRETVAKAKQFIEQEGYTFPVYFDESGMASATYGVVGLPATFFIGADGEAIARSSGAMHRDLIQQGIDMILPK